jgi:tRNA-specific 2-thiouridylase
MLQLQNVGSGLSTPSAIIPRDQLDDVPANAVVAVAMSGGVDSSVAAMRCVDAGFEVFGVTLAMWKGTAEQTKDRGCCSIDSVDDARRVCAALSIPHYAWNLEAEFKADVISEFEDEYAAGRTPNPCVRCNERIKFGVLLDRAIAAGATHVATGHYAQRGRRGAEWTLHRSVDVRKDQSYTLHRMNQRQLSAAVFPLGALSSKSETRDQARARGLITADKRESQDLCFVEGKISVELTARLAGRFAGGEIVDEEDRVLGEHRGIPFYTVGQRTGLGISPRGPDEEPWYVTRIDASRNRVVVGRRGDLEKRRLIADDVTWVGGAPPPTGTRIEAQLRAHSAPQPGVINTLAPNQVELEFDETTRLISPGQPVVIASGNEILGGAIVLRAAL